MTLPESTPEAEATPTSAVEPVAEIPVAAPEAPPAQPINPQLPLDTTPQ